MSIGSAKKIIDFKREKHQREIHTGYHNNRPRRVEEKSTTTLYIYLKKKKRREVGNEEMIIKN